MSAGPLICWHDPAKARTREIVSAFAAGCSGSVRSVAEGWMAGDAAFFGVTPAAVGTFERVQAEGRDFYYIDNPYFGRGGYFRVARNAKQHAGLVGPRAPERLAAFAITVRPWRIGGRHVLVTLQSEWWYRLHGTTLASWLGGTVAAIRAATDRPILVRRKPRVRLAELPNVAGVAELAEAPEGRPLQADLAEAWCLVTHSSNGAVEAALAGVPVFTTSADCAARAVGSGDLSLVETPRYPDGRREWAERLAANQWTVEELRRGRCWADLTAAREAA